MPIISRFEERAEARGFKKGEQLGEQRGKQRGVQQGLQSFVLQAINKKFGYAEPETTKQISNLSASQLQALSLALLDFNRKEDLVAWLQANGS